MTQVGILGHGIVGSGTAQVLLQNAEHIRMQVGEPVRVKRILDLRDFDVPYKDLFGKDPEALLSDPEISIVIECMGGVDPAYDYCRRALEAGKHVVTSNKELVATRGQELCALAEDKNLHFQFEASVAGGIPVIRPLKNCLAANHIDRILGIVNGTTNYILTRMDEVGLSFPAALAEAQREGYAERDPSADIYGYDARRKIAILAHVAFGAPLTDAGIDTTGIDHISREDLLYARAMGRTVKLIASAEVVAGGYAARVAPMMIEQESPLASVRDVFNAVLAHGDMVGDVMFYGRGAGSLPTASAIVADVVDIARNPDRPRHRPDFPAIVRVADTRPQRVFARLRFTERAAAIDAVNAAFPGATLIWLEGETFMEEFGFTTPPMREDALVRGMEALANAGHRSSGMIRIL